VHQVFIVETNKTSRSRDTILLVTAVSSFYCVMYQLTVCVI